MAPTCGVELRTARAGTGAVEDMVWLGPRNRSGCIVGFQDRRADQCLPGGVSGGRDPRAQAVGKGLRLSRTLAEKTQVGQERAAWDESTVV